MGSSPLRKEPRYNSCQDTMLELGIPSKRKKTRPEHRLNAVLESGFLLS